MKIDDRHKLPCDFIVGHVRFRKGVKLETVRQAAERWHKMVCEMNASKVDQRALDDLVRLIGPDKRPPRVLVEQE